MMEEILFLTALVVALTLNGVYGAPTNMTIAEEEFSYCTANITSCRVTITEVFDATDEALNAFDDLCSETDLVSLQIHVHILQQSFNLSIRNVTHLPSTLCSQRQTGQ